jgi:hypothetical protein
MSKRFLFLFAILASALAISCDYGDGYDYLEIINNSEYNITWVMVIDAESGYVIFNNYSCKSKYVNLFFRTNKRQ